MRIDDANTPSGLRSSMRAFRIAYDGTGYYGFQRQPDVPTVEDAVFDALRRLDVLAADADKPDGYAAAGRTDAGVSAVAQTVAFEAPDWLAPRAFNAELPADVRTWAAADVPASFHATHDATRREYTYYLYAPEKAIPEHGDDANGDTQSVDDELVEATLRTLSGTHDVHNLTPDDRNTERTLSLSAQRDSAYLTLTVSAGGFSRELVRRLVSLVRSIGTGTTPLEQLDRVLSPEPLPGHEGIGPAAPEPLVLTDVTYPGVAFRVDEEAAERTGGLFERQLIEHRTAARVAGQIRDGIE